MWKNWVGLCWCTRLLVLTWNVYVSESRTPHHSPSSPDANSRNEHQFPSLHSTPPPPTHPATDEPVENARFGHSFLLSILPFLLLSIMPFHCGPLFWPSTHMFWCDFKDISHQKVLKIYKSTRIISKVMQICMWETLNVTIMRENLRKFSFWVGEHTVKILLCLAEWKWESHTSVNTELPLTSYVNIELLMVTRFLSVQGEKVGKIHWKWVKTYDEGL